MFGLHFTNAVFYIDLQQTGSENNSAHLDIVSIEEDQTVDQSNDSLPDMETARKERTDSELSPKVRSDSASSLEWDYRDDELKIDIDDQLESSLEREINGIIYSSEQHLSLADSADVLNISNEQSSTDQ